tara:strand:+ start:2003 stop:2338 length:336 start_codon:yes stop_codon:yes gene_type:complete
MLQFNKKNLILLLIYTSFFIAIPIIKNETRLIEKKILNYKIQIKYLEKNLSEAYLEFQYLTSPEILQKKVSQNIDIDYDSLNISQVYLSFNDFADEQKKITKISIYEEQKK